MVAKKKSPHNNVVQVSFSAIVDEARDTAARGTRLRMLVDNVSDAEVNAADGARGMESALRRCQRLATEGDVLNGNADVLRQKLRVIANLCRVSLDLLDPEVGSS